MIYRLLFHLLLRRIDAERAHELAGRVLRLACAIAPLRALLHRGAVARDPALEVKALGLTFASPLGAAAGVDKDATWFEGLALLGFGFVEVGTVTARPQGGNERPRIFRLPADRALLNGMGFPNAGAEIVAGRLRRRARGARLVVGVNVGKSRVVGLADADADYRAAVRQVAAVADYLVINVSSPNTPELREMQAVDRLRTLVEEVRDELSEMRVEIPVLIKISPDADDAHVDAIADLALSLAVDGIVAVNTTVDRGVLAGSYESIASVAGGGISGAPLKERALEVLERLRARVGEEVVLVSAGGVGTPEDAWERILAGATLVQAYTGFVYGGPGWPRRVNRALARRVREAGGSSIGEFVGAGTSRMHGGLPGRPPAAGALPRGGRPADPGR
jgi:dihydroorotate dehydrogenase